MFLLDTNCWMQVARSREFAADVRRLLTEVPPRHLWLTDFALHSLAIAMRRHNSLDTFPLFIEQTGIGNAIGVVRLHPTAWQKIIDICNTLRLDIDDAYQYVAAELNGLRLVSLDTDFDKTPNGRLTPEAALKQFTEEQGQQHG